MKRMMPMGFNSTLTRKTPMRRGNAFLARTPLRKVSTKRAAQAGGRKACIAAVRERCGGRCEFPGCHSAMQDGHEILARSQGGSIVDPANVIGLCRPHHNWVTENMNKAREMGLAK